MARLMVAKDGSVFLPGPVPNITFGKLSYQQALAHIRIQLTRNKLILFVTNPLLAGTAAVVLNPFVQKQVMACWIKFICNRLRSDGYCKK